MDNRIRTTLLLATLTGLIMVVGQILGGRGGMFIALIFAAAMNFFSYWYSDKIVLKMYRASEVNNNNYPDLIGMVQALSKNANIPMPRVYVIPGEAPNAFATGRNPYHAAVAVTEGLLYILERDELAGVLAHELAHVKNRDILIGSVAATMAGAIMMLASMARWGAIFGAGRDDENGNSFFSIMLMSIIAPVAAMLIQMAVSRSREYLADETGAAIAGDNTGLARALEKISSYSGRAQSNARPETAHMFIANPLSGQQLMGLFATHPPIDQRVARLLNKAPEMRYSHDETPHRGKQNGPSEARDFWDRMK